MTEDDTFNKLKRPSYDDIRLHMSSAAKKEFDNIDSEVIMKIITEANWTVEEFFVEQHKRITKDENHTI